MIRKHTSQQWAAVLIESDWNLNESVPFFEQAMQLGINRIRLEFKLFSSASWLYSKIGY